MGEKVEFPQDLLELQRARVQARRELDEYVCTVEVERRRLHSDIVERRKWNEEEDTRWKGLRIGYQRAAVAVREHPLLAQAAQEGRLWAVEQELRAQVPAVQVVVRKDDSGTEHVIVIGDRPAA